MPSKLLSCSGFPYKVVQNSNWPFSNYCSDSHARFTCTHYNTHALAHYTLTAYLQLLYFLFLSWHYLVQNQIQKTGEREIQPRERRRICTHFYHHVSFLLSFSFFGLVAHTLSPSTLCSTTFPVPCWGLISRTENWKAPGTIAHQYLVSIRGQGYLMFGLFPIFFTDFSHKMLKFVNIKRLELYLENDTKIQKSPATFCRSKLVFSRFKNETLSVMFCD